MTGTDWDKPLDVLIIGAGFAGLYAVHALRDAGMDTLCLEAGSGVGGTWYFNRYPGARCDVESIDYSYSFDDDLQNEWIWRGGTRGNRRSLLTSITWPSGSTCSAISDWKPRSSPRISTRRPRCGALGLPQVVTASELQVEWLLQLIRATQRRGSSRVEVRADAAEKWTAQVDKIATNTIFVHTNSWYLGSNIEGKPRRFMLYTLGLANYMSTCADIADNDYEGFVFSNS